ncbi:electron transporter [Methanosarcina sp. 2.H.T.1A.6]|uniref:Rnf electron transport complex subunit RnfE n=1 Tax=unclassified Methanosarcina TaxID=2644672 RepID=UPI000622730A|nr:MULTISPECIES: Rnf electron transport complex subunit RnfE [unclassified Methanosarcina]KKG14754.1 electron transporter [Methanosarcina sp. 2.H.T.1A.3]KKG21768.1 electron transporter [Methanosarcina sp. 2.H.T.1A.15]KKG23886.1 electron transporter [Methanosarcina sp. 2.H.T.1A.6]KKG26476.1 electron transporter [Methanosarcina sp. 2.H.T.1A.8]KKH47962.1 electron transporter [Methanosarcina sp. 1.H.A.2.2]
MGDNRSVASEYMRGITKDNPIFGLVLGLCPTLAVTTSVENGIGMAAGTLFVLVGSNMLVSLLRKEIPDTVRIPIELIVIATFVSIVDMVMEAFTPGMYASLGVYIPLIVVNCIVIGRAEAYALKNGVFYSIIDAFGVGSGFLLVLMLLGGIRELLGTGGIKLFGVQLIDFVSMLGYNPIGVMTLSPGAFLTIGVLMTMVNYRRILKAMKGD